MRACGQAGVAMALLPLVWLDVAGARLGAQPSSTAPATAFVDAVVLDSAGRPVTTLVPGDVSVSVDGEPREVVSLRYVFRGTGAEAAARAGAVVGAAFAAEPSRLVLIAVDENSFAPGAEKRIVSAVRAIGDVLAPGDRVGLATLPEPRDVVADSDRQRLAQSLGRIQGRASADAGAVAAGRETAGSDRPPTAIERAASAEEPRAQAEAPGDPRTQRAEARPAERGSPAASPAAPGSIEVLAQLLEGFRDVQGPKTVIFVWGDTWGRSPTDPGSPYRPGRDLERAIATAAATRSTVHAVAVPRSARTRPDAGLEQLARDTGGLFTSSDVGGAWLGRLAEAMAGGYLIEFTARESDSDHRVRSLQVTAARPGLTILAPRLWTARDDPVPAPVDITAARAARRPEPSAEPGPAPARDAELEVVVARAAEYLEEYFRNFSSVVAEEEYSQTVARHRPDWTARGDLTEGRGSAPGRERQSVRLRSDLLLLRTSSALAWTPFRDVFEVNGKPVRDREDRLRRLFLEHPETAFQEGERLTRESARYNVGPAQRTVNTPTLGLFFLLRQHQSRIRFTRLGEEVSQGIRVWRIGFEETAGPTLISDARTAKDLPASGEFLIEPATGRVVKTLVRCEDVGFQEELTVVYERSETLGMWAPAEMKERYASGGVFVSGDAKYTRFRRFQVTTDEQVAVPKD